MMFLKNYGKKCRNSLFLFIYCHYFYKHFKLGIFFYLKIGMKVHDSTLIIDIFVMQMFKFNFGYVTLELCFKIYK